MKRRLTAVGTILLMAPICFASGWGDFSLDIGDGYSVYRCNSLDVCIGKADGSLILYPDKHESVGPVIQYITTPQYVFTKNLGRKHRDMFEGDTFQNIDTSQEFFFIIFKGTDKVAGPLSKDEFMIRPEISGSGQLDWKTPRNPNFWLPLVGNTIFLVVIILLWSAKFYWIAAPVLIGIIGLACYIRFKHLC